MRHIQFVEEKRIGYVICTRTVPEYSPGRQLRAPCSHRTAFDAKRIADPLIFATAMPPHYGESRHY